MGIEDLKARLERLLNEQGLGGFGRSEAGLLHDALVDLKVGLKEMADALERTERELASEQEHLAAALRRGQLAEGIGDAETASIAREYAERHRQRAALLERKREVQRDELTIGQQEYELLSERYRAARQGNAGGASRVGGSGPGAAIDPDEAELLKARLDRQQAQSVVDAQLEMLKRKMGKGS